MFGTVWDLVSLQLLTTLAKFVKTPQLAGFSLKGPRCDFLKIGRLTFWLHDCPCCLGPLYVGPKCFDKILSTFTKRVEFFDQKHDQSLITPLRLNLRTTPIMHFLSILTLLIPTFHHPTLLKRSPKLIKTNQNP